MSRPEKNKEFLVGALVLALIAGGVLWVVLGGPGPSQPANSVAPTAQNGEPAEGARTRAELTRHCEDFVSFAFGCDIGRPAPDPTVDIATRRANELIVMQGVIDACRSQKRPYDPELIGCFLEADGNCTTYSKCADDVVADRNPR